MKKFFQIVLIVLFTLSLFSCENDPIKKKIATMNVTDKVSQLLMPSFRYLKYEKIKSTDENGNIREDINKESLTVLDDTVRSFLNRYQFAGVILYSENIVEIGQTTKLIEDINSTSKDIPYLIATDQEGGYISRMIFANSMPGNMALCASNDPQNAYHSTNIMGKQLNALGINLSFAPVVDLNNNPNNPVIGVRSFSDNPEYAIPYVEESIKGFHDAGIFTSLKHFPGHGDTFTDSHTGLPLIDKTYEEIKDFELKTFAAGINQGTDMIMTAHIQYPKIDDTKYLSKKGDEIYLPATLSKKIIDILRNDMNYDGLICTDALNMDAIKDYYKDEDVAKMAIEAGIDILLVPVSFYQNIDDYLRELENYIENLVMMVNDKQIDIDMIDKALYRILSLKEKLSKYPKEELTDSLFTSTYQDKVFDIAKDTITLIKNDEVLPLNKDNKTLLLTPYNSQVRSIEYGLSLLENDNIKTTADIYNFGDDDTKSFDLKRIKEYDSIVFVSSMYGFEDINDEYSRIIDLIIEEAKKNSQKTILISAQLPYDLARYNTDAKLAVYCCDGITSHYNNYQPTSYPINIPMAIYRLFADETYKAKLPIDIPVLELSDGYYKPTADIMCPRGTGLQR